MNTTPLALYTARDAKTKFGELLDTALGRPVGITKHDRLTAYMVSKFQFETMLEKIQELEDQLWLLKADAARKEGFVSSDDVSTFLTKNRNTDNEFTINQTGDEIHRDA